MRLALIVVLAAGAAACGGGAAGPPAAPGTPAPPVPSPTPTPNPFAASCGQPLPAFADAYGYGIKGASVVLHRPKANLRYQVFQFSDWPGGIYGTPAFQGARAAALLRRASGSSTYPPGKRKT